MEDKKPENQPKKSFLASLSLSRIALPTSQTSNKETQSAPIKSNSESIFASPSVATLDRKGTTRKDSVFTFGAL
jgi:hypothetical protein